jgi:hypothetical protein
VTNADNPNSYCSQVIASDAARILIGCYRRGDFDDPEVFLRALIALFMHYPEEIVRRVTDPVTGVPGSLKWPPTIAEVKSACEERMAPYYREARLAREAQERRLRIEGPSDAPETRSAAVAAWEAEKARIQGKASEEEIRRAAEQRLSEIAREGVGPVTIGTELARKIKVLREELEAGR